MKRVTYALLALAAACALWLVFQASHGGPANDPDASHDTGATNSGQSTKHGDDDTETHARPTLQPSDALAATENEDPGYTLEGRVVNKLTSEGIAGVTIVCVQRVDKGEPEPPVETTVSDAEGRFSLERLAGGMWLVMPLHRDYTNPFVASLVNYGTTQGAVWGSNREGRWAHAKRVGLIVDLNDSTVNTSVLTLEMEPGIPMSGRVLGPGDELVANAPIRIYLPYRARLKK